MQRMSLFPVLTLVALCLVSSALSLDVSNLPPAIQARQYVRSISEAIAGGEHEKVVALCEELLANPDIDFDPDFRFYYARSLLAVGRREDSVAEMEEFLNAPDIDEELIDEGLAILERAQMGDVLARAKELLAPAMKTLETGLPGLDYAQLPSIDSEFREAVALLKAAVKDETLAPADMHEAHLLLVACCSGGPLEDRGEAVRLLRAAAESGSPGAQFMLGEAYDKGLLSIGQDAAEATQWYMLADQNCFAPAQIRLVELGLRKSGWMGISMDPEDDGNSIEYGYSENGVFLTDVLPDGPGGKAGIKVWDLLVSYNNIPIKNMAHLRSMTFGTRPGSSVPVAVIRGKDRRRLVLTANIEASPGDVESLWRAHNWNKKENDPAVLEAFIAAKGGSRQRVRERGEALFKARQYAEAFTFFSLGAELNDAESQSRLGDCYNNGNGVTQNLEQAVVWYRKAADQGNAKAQDSLGDCYFDGHGVAQNHEQAVAWYRKAADQGNANSQNKLGGCYYNGNGIAQNREQAVAWYRKAADQGNAQAQDNLGVCYQYGHGVAKNSQQAVAWYRKASEQGHARATAELGVMYFNSEGVVHDCDEALRLLKLAEILGYKGLNLQSNISIVLEHIRNR